MFNSQKILAKHLPMQSNEFRWQCAGSEFLFRPVSPADADSIFCLHQSLSQVSKRQRFNTSLSTCSTEFLEQLSIQIATLQPQQGFGTIIIDMFNQSTVGLAFVMCDGDQGGEVAIVIHDDFQSQGLGSKLFEELLTQARCLRLNTLTANICADNSSMRQILRKSGLSYSAQLIAGTFAFQLDLQSSTGWSHAFSQIIDSIWHTWQEALLLTGYVITC